MPTYEYRCPNGHEFEKFQRISAPPEAECPECGAPSERILSGGAGLLFKGSGFYITDYRSEGYRKAAEQDRPKESKSGDGGASGSSDSGGSGGSGGSGSGGGDSGSGGSGSGSGGGKASE